MGPHPYPPWFSPFLTGVYHFFTFFFCVCVCVTHTGVHDWRPQHCPSILASTFLSSVLKSPGETHYQGVSTDILSKCGPANSCLAPGWNSHHIHCVTISISRKVESVILYLVIWLSLDAFCLGFPANPFFTFLVRPLLLLTGTTMCFIFTRKINCK